MKSRPWWLMALALMLAFAGESAWAHGSRTRVGVGFYVGGPLWGPPIWYPPPYYYPPQVVVVPPSAPPVYVEQQVPAEAPAPAAQAYWYYCAGSKGYYPYVKECPEGWQKVLPQPEK